MRRRTIGAAVASLATVVAVAGAATGPAAAQVTRFSPAIGQRTAVPLDDNLPNRLAEGAAELRKEAISQLIDGSATLVQRTGSEVIRLPNGRWVEWKGKPKVDPVLTILVEFGDQTRADTGGTPGPSHNRIPEPDRVYDGSPTDDNTSVWRPDFSPEYYRELLFSRNKQSMSDFYLKQSSGRYTVTGDVTDWVTVPYNEARYGSDRIPFTDGLWNFVRDGAQAWYESRIAAGQTPAQIRSYLSRFDVWDRYDYDNDGDFNEKDGYLDRVQLVHAGRSDQDGGGAQGPDAMITHHWYAFSTDAGSTGPAGNLAGGTQIGASGIWIGDYNAEAEDEGLGVFCHEFGHDLGLPDLYDLATNDNGTGYWTLMSVGTHLNEGRQDIGTSPGYLGPWEKLTLGWLDFRTVTYGTGKTYALGAAGDTSGTLPQAIVVNLPDQHIVTKYNTPHSGAFEWWGGKADNTSATLTRELDLTGATSASLSTKAWYEIEEGFDFLHAEVSTDGGSTWTAVGEPVDGDSRGAWVDLSYDLSGFAGQVVAFRFRYQTDPFLHLKGAFLDDITVTVGDRSTTDDVEAGTGVWTANGWTRFGGTTDETFPHFYIAENRQFTGYDTNLRTGPFNFGFFNTRERFVERFPYHPGLLVWYVNHAEKDNDTSQHPGTGLVLPVDARPATIRSQDGRRFGNATQAFDATFGAHPTQPLTVHIDGVPTHVPAQPGIPVFDDTNREAYWARDNPWHSVKVAGTGTRIEVLKDLPEQKTMVVKISF